MAGLFGTMGGLQGALGGLFSGGGVSMPEPQKPSGGGSGGRRGLFGGRIDPLQLQQAFAMAQAAMAGDYGAVSQIAAQGQRNRLLQQQAEAEAEEAEAGYLSAHQALSARGIDKHAIHAMRPEERSQLLQNRLEAFTLAPNNVRVTPGAPGADPETFRNGPGPTDIERTVDYLRSQGATPEFIDAYIQNEAIRPQWVTPPAGGYAQNVGPQVSLRGGSAPQAQAPDGAPPPPPPGFVIDQPQGGPGRAAAPATFPGHDPNRYPPGYW